MEKKIATLLSSLKNFGKPPLSLSKKLEIPPPKKSSVSYFILVFFFLANPCTRATSAEAASRLQMRFKPANVPSGEDRRGETAFFAGINALPGISLGPDFAVGEKAKNGVRRLWDSERKTDTEAFLWLVFILGNKSAGGEYCVRCRFG